MEGYDSDALARALLKPLGRSAAYRLVDLYALDQAVGVAWIARKTDVRLGTLLPLPGRGAPQPWSIDPPSTPKHWARQVAGWLSWQVEAGCGMWGQRHEVDGVAYLTVTDTGFARPDST